VLQGAGGEVALQMVVEAVRAVLLAPVELGTAGMGVGSTVRGRDKTVEVKPLVAVIDVDVAQALAIRHDLVEVMGKLIPHYILVAFVVVPFRVAQKRVAVDLVALGVAVQAAHCGQGLIVGQGVIALQLRIQCQFGAVIGGPGEAGRQQHARVFGVVHLLAAGIAHTDQPIVQGFGIVQRAGGIKGQVVTVKTPGADLDLVPGLGARTLGDHIDHPPRLVLPIQHGGRALEHFDTLQGVGIDLRGAAQAAG